MFASVRLEKDAKITEFVLLRTLINSLPINFVKMLAKYNFILNIFLKTYI